MANINETLSDRTSTHGDLNDHAKISQALKRTIIEGVSYQLLTDTQKEALEMIVHKIARIVSGNPNLADHWHDIAGYSKLAEDRIEI